MTNEIILFFWKDIQKHSSEMSYSKDIVEPIVEEIIRLKVKYEDMILPIGEGNTVNNENNRE
jgi:hypothetical protein